MSSSNLHEAASLAEFIEGLKSEQGDSYQTLGVKIGIAGSTLHRIVKEGTHPDDDTLDKIADYAGVTRQWLYAITKNMPARPKYSRAVSMLAALVEEAPPDIQEDVLTMARALIQSRKKQATKEDQDGD